MQKALSLLWYDTTIDNYYGEKSMKQSFQEELNHEIKKRFSLLAILVSAFLFLLLILFVFAIQYR